MKKIIQNEIASIAPLLKFFLVLGFIGLLYGIFDVMMVAVMDTSNTMNLLMWRAWIFCIVVIFLVMIGWLLMRSQKTGYSPEG